MSDKVLEAVQGLEKTVTDKQAATEKILTEQKSFIETKYAEAQKALTDLETKSAAEVKQLNEELAKAGKDLGEIREQVKNMQARSGRFRGMGGETEKKAAEIISDTLEEHFKEIQAVAKGNNVKIGIEHKAITNMTAANNLTGNALATYDLTPAVRGRRKVNIRDLVPVINSATGIWKFYRQPVPVGDGSLAPQTTHANPKNQLDYNLTEQTVTVDYIAGFVRFAKQMAQDLPFLQNFIANELLEDYKRTESGTFLPILTSGATGATTVSGSGVPAENIIDWIANLLANDYDPNAIITTAAVWSAILRTKPQNYSIPGAIQIDPDGNIRFQGIPLTAQNNMAAGHVLVGDFSKAAIIQTEGMSINFYEQDSDNVQRNLITARVECRAALAILRPDAFVYGTATATS